MTDRLIEAGIVLLLILTGILGLRERQVFHRPPPDTDCPDVRTDEERDA